MATVNGTFRGDPSLARANKSKQDEIDQLRRRLGKPIPKAKPASGGIVDIARVESAAVYPSLAGIKWPSGAQEASPFDTTYAAPTSMVDDSSASWLSITDSDIYPTEDGFYQAWCYVTLTWPSLAAACGTGASVYLNGRDVPGASLCTVYSDGQGVLSACVTNGPEWMTTTNYWRVEVDGLAATSAELVTSAAMWRITKYGAA